MGVNPPGQGGRDAGRRRQIGRLAGVRVKGGSGGGGPVLRDGRGHLVGRHVAGVHGLGGARIPGEAGGQFGVQAGERRGQGGGHIRRQRQHAPSLTRPAPRSPRELLSSGAPASTERVLMCSQNLY